MWDHMAAGVFDVRGNTHKVTRKYDEKYGILFYFKLVAFIGVEFQ